jgi:hypothetical protein
MELARKAAERAASAHDPITKATFENEHKHFLMRAEQAEKQGERPGPTFKPETGRRNRKS